MKRIFLALLLVVCSVTFSCVNKEHQNEMVSDFHEGITLYAQVREIPKSVREQNYADTIVYQGNIAAFWEWKHKFVTIYSKNEWDLFVKEAVQRYGPPHDPYSARDLLKYQLEPVLR